MAGLAAQSSTQPLLAASPCLTHCHSERNEIKPRLNDAVGQGKNLNLKKKLPDNNWKIWQKEYLMDLKQKSP